MTYYYITEVDLRFIFLISGIFIASIFETYFSNFDVFWSGLLSLVILIAGLAFNHKGKKKLVMAVFLLLGFSLFFFKLGLINSVEIDGKSLFGQSSIVNVDMTIIDKVKDKEDYKIYLAKIKGLNKFAYVHGINDELKPGELVNVNLEMKSPPAKRNFGDMDYKKYLNSKGINLWFNNTGNVERLGNKAFSVEAYPIKIRNILEGQIDKFSSGEAGALAKAMILGNTKFLEDDLVMAFRDGGVAHILSVSGLHVGYFYLLFSLVFTKSVKSKKRVFESSLYMPILLTFVYVVITGMQSPAVRAFIMFSIPKIGNGIFGEDKSIKKNYLSITGTLMLIFNPFLIYDIGFLISISCIFAMGELSFGKKPINNPIMKLMSLSATAWLGSIPLILWSFGRISLAGLIANIPIIPLSGACTVIGILAIIISFFSEILGAILFYFCNTIMYILIWITRGFAMVFPVFILPRLPFLVIGALSALIYLNFSKAKKDIFTKSIIWVLIFSGLIQLVCQWIPNGKLEINFLDVGQGDSALISFPSGGKMLVDGGEDEDFLISVLTRMGLYKIDTMLITHDHKDHSAGVIKAMENYRPRKVILPESIKKSQEWIRIKELSLKYAIELVEVKKGDELYFGECKLKVLMPDGKTVSAEDKNSDGIIFLLSYKDFDCLFTADSGIQEEEAYFSDIESDSIEILKIPHHASKFSSGEKLVKGLTPLIGVISVGKNFYGHPSRKIISDYTKVGTKILRTDLSGAIRINSDGKSYRIQTVR